MNSSTKNDDNTNIGGTIRHEFPFSDSKPEEKCLAAELDDGGGESTTEEFCCIFPDKLTEDLKENPKEIYETEELRILTTQVFEHLASSTTEYCFLSGENSVGKTTVVENLVQKINSKKSPKFFWAYKVLQFDAYDFILLENDVFFNSLAVAISELCANNIYNIIIYVKHVNFLSSEILMMFHRFYGTMLSTCDKLELRFIFSVHYTFWENAPDYPFLVRSVVKEVIMPKFDDLNKILAPKVKEFEKIYGCTISEDLLNFLISLIMTNISDSQMIKTYIFFVDMVLTKVRLEERDTVTIEDVYRNFEKCFSDWQSFSETERARIAYHEAGHTVLGLIALSDYYQLLAVTAIPALELSSLGATIEYFKTHLYNVDKKLLKKFSAFYLAGREAEVLAGYKRNNGAKSDLNQSSEMLVETIATTGLFKKASRNYYYDLENFVSDKAVKKIEEEAMKFSNKSAKYARKILDKNWELVEMIANRLLADGLVSGVEVEKIYKSYLKKISKKKK